MFTVQQSVKYAQCRASRHVFIVHHHSSQARALYACLVDGLLWCGRVRNVAMHGMVLVLWP